MKYIIALLLLFICIFQVNAQDLECTLCPIVQTSKTKSNFNATFINHRHIVTLAKGNKMIVEMYNVQDYELLKNISTIFTAFKNETAFLKDSLENAPTENVRIDYSYNTEQEFRKVRLKRYPSNGDIYLVKKGEVSGLKVEQDTIHILIERMITDKRHPEYKRYRPIQITLVLNNYSDIDKLIGSTEIQHIIDTMAMVSKPPRPNPSHYKTTILYHPNATSNDIYWNNSKLQVYKGILGDEGLSVNAKSAPKRLEYTFDIGAGLLANNIAPMAEAGLEYHFLWSGGPDYIKMVRLTLSNYSLFDVTGGKLNMYNNLFVNAEYGLLSNLDEAFPVKRATVGVGYLVGTNGVYLTPHNTFKVYLDIPIGETQFCIIPEVIFTNDFKTIFPGITFKGFLNRD